MVYDYALAQDPDHRCTIEAEHYEFCSKASPAGGLAPCAECGTMIFVPPETCLERLRPADLEVTIDLAARRRAA